LGAGGVPLSLEPRCRGITRKTAAAMIALSFTNSTQFYTIEGNTGSHVDVRIRTVADIDRVGKAQ